MKSKKKAWAIREDEIQACREDICGVFRDKWAERGVEPVSGAIALCLCFASIARRTGASKDEVHKMLDEAIKHADGEISVDTENLKSKIATHRRKRK
jgi:ABC-type antimicrobial peptide transport system ATPase subunit